MLKILKIIWRGNKMKKRILSLVLLLCMAVTLVPVTAFAAANNISVTGAEYFSSGAVKSLNINFGWDTASANSRMTVMTERLRSAGEAGTDKYYGDFTDLGYYGRAFGSWDEVLANSNKFGMLYYTDEHKMESGKINTMSVYFDDGDIPLNVDGTYYLYLWTYYGGHYYPDNLFMVLQVKNGVFQFAPAKDRNSTGSFTVLKQAVTTTPEFKDVKRSDYFFEPVNWALEKGITNGAGVNIFAPNNTCTRAQILTFLWRAAGSPESTAKMTFTDVAEGEYYYKPVLWAIEKGIVDAGTAFEPNAACTRSETVRYMWRYAGAPASETVPAFTDVAADTEEYKAVAWALDAGVTTGTSDTTFSPEATCLRGQIVTFLWRAFAE